MPGVAATCDIDEYKLHYYGSLRIGEPERRRAQRPILDFTARQGHE
jgi:hypothetical protein